MLKARRLRVSLNSRLESNKEEREETQTLSSEYGTYKTVKARFWPWLSCKKSPEYFEVIISSLINDPPLEADCALILFDPRADLNPHQQPPEP